jgi:hypothetical protein
MKENKTRVVLYLPSGKEIYIDLKDERIMLWEDEENFTDMTFTEWRQMYQEYYKGT